MKYYLMILVSVSMISCSSNDDDDMQVKKSVFTEQQWLDAANYSKEKGGSSVLIFEKGDIVFEDYHNGSDEYTATHIYSATKLFWSAVAALAKQQGLIQDYEENVSRTIVEWKDEEVHPGKSSIQIKHLLTLSSGLSQDFLILSEENNTYDYVVNNLDMVSLPGEKFSYGPSNYYTFGEMLQRKLQSNGISSNPLEYLETEIFERIGLEYESWTHDASGNPNIPNGCTITPRNWVKFGQFLLQDGEWEGKQIIESSYLQEMYIPTGPNLGHGNFCWLNTNGGYGFNQFDSAPSESIGGMIYYDGYTEIIGGLGAGKNRMYLIPSLEVVILRQTLLGEDTFDDHEFLELLLQ